MSLNKWLFGEPFLQMRFVKVKTFILLYFLNEFSYSVHVLERILKWVEKIHSRKFKRFTLKNWFLNLRKKGGLSCQGKA